MRERISSLVVLTVILLLSAAALARYHADGASALVIVEEGIAVGGSYHLTSLDSQTAIATGGGYRLLAPSSANASPPPSAEVGCCCTYLPCTLRAFP